MGLDCRVCRLNETVIARSYLKVQADLIALVLVHDVVVDNTQPGTLQSGLIVALNSQGLLGIGIDSLAEYRLCDVEILYDCAPP